MFPNEVRLSCQEAGQLSSGVVPETMKLPPTSLRVENCPELNLNLHQPLPWPLSSLLLANISTLFIALGSNSMHATKELILLDSTITSNFHFTNKKGFSKLIVEGCTFKKAFAVYSELGGGTAEVPDLVSITGSEFQGEVEMVMKGGERRDPSDTFILLHNNWFQAAVNLATFDLSASLIGNTFTLASDANINTDENFRPDYRIGLLALLSSPGDVNITGNSMEVPVRGRHGHHGFVAAEEQLGREELSEFILIEPSDADALVDGNTFVLRYTD